MEVKFVRTSPKAHMPRRMTIGAGGFDLEACLDMPMFIPPGATCLVPTGLRLEIPQMAAALILPRSGLSLAGVRIANSPGLIDADYRGEIMVALHNTQDVAYVVEPFSRVAQLLVISLTAVTFTEAEDLSESSRGAGGFGSTDLDVVKKTFGPGAAE